MCAFVSSGISCDRSLSGGGESRRYLVCKPMGLHTRGGYMRGSTVYVCVGVGVRYMCV